MLASIRDDEVEMEKPKIPQIYDDSRLDDFVDADSWYIFKVW